MKVLLINPPMNHAVHSGINSFGDKLLVGSSMPPLGLMYLGSYLRSTGKDVRIFDAIVNGIDALKMMVRTYYPDVIGITSTTLTLYDAIQTAKTVKGISKHIPVVIGGAHCDIYPQETANFDCIDYVIRGDGWKPLSKLLSGKFHNGKILDLEPLEDFDSVPFPDRDMIDIMKYHSIMTQGRLATTMVSSLGCPYNCTFCHQPHYKKWRARSASNVVAEMKEIVAMGINEIEIYDDTFTYDRDRVLEVCDLILSTKLKVDWNIRTRVDKVDLPLLKLMAKAGCKRVNYGIESVTPSVLKILRKGFNLEQIKDAIRWTKQCKVGMQAYFMLGSPGETKEQMLDTIKFANKYVDDYAFYTITSLMPKTYLYDFSVNDGRCDDFWRKFAKDPTPDFVSRFWDETNREDLKQILNYAYRSFYLRPSYILRQIIKLRSAKELFRKAMMAIRMFWLTMRKNDI